MKIEKKLIACSMLAITIGIATIIPLAFLMSPARAQTTDDAPWFNLKLTNAYYKASTQSDVDGYVVGGVIHNLVSYSTANAIGFHWTTNQFAINNLAEARLEYYQLQIYSDQGQIENMTTAVGFNSTKYAEPDSFHFERKGWFNTTVSNGAGFVWNQGGLLGFLGPDVNTESSSFHGSGCFANTTLPQEFLNLQNAHTVCIDVYRLGYVTFYGNSTVVTLANDEVIQHIVLTKEDDYFIYGNVPQIAQLPSSSSVPPVNP